MIDLRKRWRAFCLAASLVAAQYPSAAPSAVAPSAVAPSTVVLPPVVLPPVVQASLAPQDSAVVYVARRGWHVDIGFAAADLQPPLRSLLDEFPGAQYLFFGFGDRRYLLAKNRNAPVLLAALWPGRGMILATGLRSPPTVAFGVRQVVALAVTLRQASDAQAFVWYSLDRPSVNDPVRSYAAGPYEGSLFFTATPKYSAFHTCNTWAAESLATAALPIHSAGVVFAGQLWSQVRRAEKKQSAVARQMAISSNASPPGLAPTDFRSSYRLRCRAGCFHPGKRPWCPSFEGRPRLFPRPEMQSTPPATCGSPVYSTDRLPVLDLRLLDRRVKFHHG
jgi:hypothetical protein